MNPSASKTTATERDESSDRGASKPVDGGRYEISAGSREQFIPLRKSDLKALLTRSPWTTDDDRAAISQIAASLDGVIHAELHDKIERLKDTYAPFDPDVDTPLKRDMDDAARAASVKSFFNQLGELLRQANYRRVPLDELTRVLDVHTAWGFNLEVDFHIFERLEIYARGDRLVKKRRRSSWPPFREETFEVPVHQRLIVAFRLRDAKHLPPNVDLNTIHLKIFKNIPKADLEMLLPGTRVRMSWIDQSKIIVPTVGGVLMLVFKLIQLVVVSAVLGLFGFLSLLGLAGGFIGYGVRSFFGYLNTRDKYHLNLTRNLYYQNLDSNAGTFFRLLDEAEEQEFRETLIAYLVLWRSGGSDGMDVAEIDAQAERFIREQTQFNVDFEVSDAVHKLNDWGLATAASGGRWRAAPPEKAVEVLRARWESLCPLGDPDTGEPLPPPVFLLMDDDIDAEDEDWEFPI